MDGRGIDARGPTRFILALVVAVVMTHGPAAPSSAAADEHRNTAATGQQTEQQAEQQTGDTSVAAPSSTPDETAPDRPVPTVSEFYPEDNNLSDCLGLVERPGCGSKARGGWRQSVVFAVLVVGLGLIVWRISVGVRSNRNSLSGTGPVDDDS
jgi:hypothetical protein